MALVLKTFEESLTDKLVAAANKNNKEGVTLEAAMGELAKAIAGEVGAYIKTATITIAPLAIVTSQTTTSPSPQSNPDPVVIEGGVS